MKKEKWKLRKIVKSQKTAKKYDAHFYEEILGIVKIVSFGAAGYSDFTKHKDEDRRKRYMVRHKRNEKWNDPLTPGALSRWVLWNKPTLKASIDDFKKRFKL
jgi:hypothetical protein